jgi:transposase-like protein
MTVRSQLVPRIQAAGILQTARAAGIAPSVLCEWIHQKRNRRLGDEQIDAILRALDLNMEVTENARPDTQDRRGNPDRPGQRP